MSDQAAVPEVKDKLIVTGLDALNGEYDFSIIEMMSIGMPDSLTNREGHELKKATGVRIGELEDALAAGDNDVLVQFAITILRRTGRRVDEDKLWDAPMGTLIQFDFASLRMEDEDVEDENRPPEESPLDESGSTETEDVSSRSGGGSLRRISGSQA